MTQGGLAQTSGIPLGTIRECEQNKREPLLSKAGKLARALTQPLEAFLPIDGEDASKGEPAKKKRKRKL